MYARIIGIFNIFIVIFLNIMAQSITILLWLRKLQEWKILPAWINTSGNVKDCTWLCAAYD